MFVVERETRQRKAKKINENENKFKPSQTGKMRLRSKDLVAGTDDIDDDDDVVEILDSPSPVKKKPKKAEASSIFGKPVVIDDDDSFIFGERSQSKALKALQQNPLPMIVSPLVKKKPVTKSTTKAAKSKRAIESESDDDVEIVLPEPKRQKSTKEVPLKSSKEVPKKKAKEVLQSSTSSSSQLMTIQKANSIFTLKRKNGETEDDLFSFDSKHAKKEAPFVTRQRSKNVEPAVASTSSSVTSVSAKQSDENLDLKPGREIITPSLFQWLSKSTLDCVKKEPESEPNEMASANSLSEPEMKSISNIIHVALDINNSTSELGGGKAFKKKINYKPQTQAVEQRIFDWADADLLYPPTF